LKEFRPHIFFDDQVANIESASDVTPSTHVPFGIANKAAEIVKGVREASESQPKA
jgi:5'-nucleotidase